MGTMKANTHLLKLPHVVQDHILSFLTIKEQLRVRLVCKTTKDWVDQRAKLLAQHLPETVIKNNGRNTFRVFCNRQTPHRVSHVYLQNEGLELYEDEKLDEFLFHCALSVTNIRVKRYYICNSIHRQTQFFNSFPNLESLEIDEVWVANSDTVVGNVPTTFHNLETLKFGLVKCFDEPDFVLVEPTRELNQQRKKSIRLSIWNVLEFCEHLKFLKVPVAPKNLFDNSFDECFRLLNYIRHRTRGITERGFRAHQYVMKCDLNSFNCCASSLEVLLIVGARMRIQFLNVNSKVFRQGSSFCIVGVPPRARFDYIYSFISTSLVNRAFDYIQKLTFKASLIQNECIIGREKGPTLFPSLKVFVIILDIGLDSISPNALYSKTVSEPNQQRNVCFPRADQVLKFFFPETLAYNGVHTAEFIFANPVFPHQRRASPEKLGTLPAIIKCLPNLRNLTVGGWNCRRVSYFKLWHGFPHLERLCIDSCSTLSSSCLIDGNGNPNNPSNFQHLPELEYLELRGLEDMPGIYSASGFKPAILDVFAKMGLVPFPFLSRPQSAVWIRPSVMSRTSFNTSTMVTRSVTRALQSRRGMKRARRFKPF